MHYVARFPLRPLKDVQIAGVRVAPERLLHLQRQAVHAAPHVGVPDRQPHPNARTGTGIIAATAP